MTPRHTRTLSARKPCFQNMKHLNSFDVRKWFAWCGLWPATSAAGRLRCCRSTRSMIGRLAVGLFLMTLHCSLYSCRHTQTTAADTVSLKHLQGVVVTSVMPPNCFSSAPVVDRSFSPGIDTVCPAAHPSTNRSWQIRTTYDLTLSDTTATTAQVERTNGRPAASRDAQTQLGRRYVLRFILLGAALAGIFFLLLLYFLIRRL